MNRFAKGRRTRPITRASKFSMTDTLERIDLAASLEALSDIARDAEAMMDVEHRSEAERAEIRDALKARTIRLAEMLSAG